MRDIKEKNPERGAALVELAVVFPFLLLILVGVIEFGLLFYNQQVLTNSSREGARFGIARFDVNKIDGFDENDIIDIVDNYLFLGPTPIDDRLITFDPVLTVNTVVDGEGGSYAEDLTVTVTYDYTFLVPELLGFGTSMQLTAETVMKME
jgi:Flp pilus assembly protein TadG